MVRTLKKLFGLGIMVFTFLIFLCGWNTTGAAELLAKNLEELEQLFDKAENCGDCHEQHYEEWKRSYHSKSMITTAGGMKKYIEEIQKKEGRFPNREELLGCFDCHAPTLRFASDKLMEQVGRLVAEGKTEELKGFTVECSYCHTAQVTGKPEQGVYYGPIENPADTDHKSKYSPKIASAEMCRSCHQSFYKRLEVYCSTVYDSWSGTRISNDKECQFCHMKAKDGLAANEEEMDSPIQRVIHDHTFPGGHSPSILQEAAKLDLMARLEDSKISFAVNIKNLAGHQFPDT